MKQTIAYFAIATGFLWVQSVAIAHPSFRSTLENSSQVAVNPTIVALCPAQLPGAIAAVIDRPPFQRSRWGILIQTLPTAGTSITLYTRDAQRYFIPASNAKLLTTAAALTQLKSQYRIRTSVYKVAAPSNQTILRIVGRGDPSLTGVGLRSLAQQLSRQGIRRIDRLIGDDSYFGGADIQPTWEWSDLQAGYGATANGLVVNQNAIALKLLPQAIGQTLKVQWDDPTDAAGWQINNTSMTVATTEPEFVEVGRNLSQPLLRVEGQLRVGSEPEPVAVAVLDPAQNFLQQFRRALVAEKITVAQALVASNPKTGDEMEIVNLQSPPLSTLLVETNQESNNLYAEVLLRTLGIVQRSSNSTNRSTLEAGLAEVKATLTELGVDPKGYVLVDGSGLSRHNLVSPEALVQTLKAMAKSPEAAVYRSSLPVAGRSGTLVDRLVNTPAQGMLQAKTGTLEGAIALSGYLTVAGYQPLVFSILVNQSDASIVTLRGAVDEIVLLMTRLRSC